MGNYKSTLEKLIAGSGITINGKKPCDIQVHNPQFYQRVVTEGSVGLGESYMEGWWDCEKLDQFFYRLFTIEVEEKAKKNWKFLFLLWKARWFNLQTKSKAKKSISQHYDLGNELYQKMLDPLMMYSCGVWDNAKNLTESQEQKLKLICEKLHLKPGQEVLDIGCGWGGFAYYAAKNYQVKVVGITISKEQKKIAEIRCEDLDVEIRFQDYRDLHQQFDRIVSIGMLEHVGPKNYKEYMQVVNRNLKENGICLLSFIGGNKTGVHTDPWIHKYIFPHGAIPSIHQIGKAIEGKLVMQDLHNVGLHYDKTLLAWEENFKNSWESLKQDYDEVFYRMWLFYLACSAASFRARKLHLWEIIFLKPTFSEEYTPVRV